MKKELKILTLGGVIGGMLLIFFNINLTKKDKGETPKPLINKVNVVKLDTITFITKDAVKVEFVYALKNIDKIGNKTSQTKKNTLEILRNFTLSKNSEYFYDMDLPNLSVKNIIISHVHIEDSVFQEINKRKTKDVKFVNLIVKEIEKDGWEVYKIDTYTHKLRKGDFILLISEIPNYNDICVVYKEHTLKLTEKEKTIIRTTVLEKLTLEKLTKDEKVRKEILEKFGD